MDLGSGIVPDPCKVAGAFLSGVFSPLEQAVHNMGSQFCAGGTCLPGSLFRSMNVMTSIDR